MVQIYVELISGDNKDELQKRRNDMYDYLTKKKGLLS